MIVELYNRKWKPKATESNNAGEESNVLRFARLGSRAATRLGNHVGFKPSTMEALAALSRVLFPCEDLKNISPAQYNQHV